KLLHVHVNGVDSGCAVVEQAIREATVRSADIQTNAPAWDNGKVFQRAFQLHAAAADEFLRSADDFNASVIRNGHASLSRSLAFTLNSTARIMAIAFWGGAAKPRSTGRRSSRLRAAFGFMTL